MDKRRIDELGISYVEKLSLYEEYAARIRNLIQDLVEREGVEFHAIEGWAKTPSELLHNLNALEDPAVTAALAGKTVVKVIAVPGRLVNIVVCKPGKCPEEPG